MIRCREDVLKSFENKKDAAGMTILHYVCCSYSTSGRQAYPSSLTYEPGRRWHMIDDVAPTLSSVAASKDERVMPNMPSSMPFGQRPFVPTDERVMPKRPSTMQDKPLGERPFVPTEDKNPDGKSPVITQPFSFDFSVPIGFGSAPFSPFNNNTTNATNPFETPTPSAPFTSPFNNNTTNATNPFETPTPSAPFTSPFSAPVGFESTPPFQFSGNAPAPFNPNSPFGAIPMPASSPTVGPYPIGAKPVSLKGNSSGFEAPILSKEQQFESSIQFILDDVNTKNNTGETALLMIVKACTKESDKQHRVDALLKRMADVNLSVRTELGLVLS